MSTPALKPYMTVAQVYRGTEEVANSIRSIFGQAKDVTLLVVMNGGAFFAVDLARQLPPAFGFESVRVASYNGTENSGLLTWLSPLPDVAGKHIIIVDEICDSGRTLHAIRQAVIDAGAATCSTAVLISIDKKSTRARYGVPDFSAIDLPTDPGFLIGCGMDYHGTHRSHRALYLLDRPATPEA